MTAALGASNGHDPVGAAYEALRRSVLGDAPVGGSGGLVLLLREGIAGWMARGAACSAPVVPTGNRDRRTAAPLVSSEIHAAVVRVLVSMALGGREEMRA